MRMSVSVTFRRPHRAPALSDSFREQRKPSKSISPTLAAPGYPLERRERTIARQVSQQTETPVVRTTTQARDGVTGHGVRYVLLISTAAVIVLLAAVWVYYFH